MWNPNVFRYKTAVMQRLQQAAAHGYDRYVSGECRNERIQALADKFSTQYSVDANRGQRCWAQKNGRANAMLFLYPKRESTDWLWWLLVSPGEGVVVERERLQAVTGQRTRLSWLLDYEMTLHMRAGRSSPSVTWRMKRRLYDSWHTRIRSAIRTRSTDVPAKQALVSLYRSPGFAGIRAQVWRLSQLFRREWIRTRKSTKTMPPTRVPGFVRHRACTTIPLAEIVQRLEAGRSAFPRAQSDQHG